MRRRRWVVGMVAVATLALSGGIEASAAPGPSGDTARVCSPVPGQASCNAIQLLNPGLNWAGTHAAAPGKGPGKKPPGGGGGSTAPLGYYPTDLQSAYNLSSFVSEYSKGTPPTVAVVDAYNDPNAASDLATYRSYFRLPTCNATTGSGCVTVESQSPLTSPLPRSNSSWSEEISLDLDMVSSICPYCHILLVEANSASYADLGTAVNTAASSPGVVAISNSYGGSETSSELSYDTQYYKHADIAITASAGDSGYGVEYPAASPYVVAVGGTTLSGSATAGWSQTVWSGTGSGCSSYEPAPLWQSSMSKIGSTCSYRTVGDVAAVADPNTGVAVYDSFREPGWMVFGGTSVASPIVASIFALAGNTGGFSFQNGASTAAKSFYSNSSGSYPLIPVTSGSNGSCGGTYLCDAGASLSNGYNGPTGMGTPYGTNGF